MSILNIYSLGLAVAYGALKTGSPMPDRLDSAAFRRYAWDREIAATTYDEDERSIILALIAANKRMSIEKNCGRKPKSGMS